MVNRKNLAAGIGVICVVLLSAILGVPSSARAQAAPASHSRLTEAQALDLQKKFQAAVVAADASALGTLMADDAIFVHGSALVQTKAQFVDSLVNGQMKLPTYESQNPKVILFDGGAVISGLTSVVVALRNPGAPPLHLTMQVSTVWVAKPAGWQVILNQGTPVPAPPAVRPVAESNGPPR